MDNWVRVYAPATVANFGPGFDVLGCALEKPGDIVQVCINSERKVEIVEVTGNSNIPIDPKKNTASIGANLVIEKLGTKQGVKLKINKQMNIGTGLGSSAASAAAAVWGTNLVFGKPFEKKELLEICLKAENISDNGWHGDNVFPSLLGGIVLIKNYEPLEIILLPVPENLIIAVVSPKIIIKTEHARKILPLQIPLKDAIYNWGNLASLISSLHVRDIKLIGESINDKIIEPIRASLIPEFYKVKQAALDNGAYGCSISGSGPSIFAITDDNIKAQKIVKAMQDVFLKKNISSSSFISNINTKGAIEINNF